MALAQPAPSLALQPVAAMPVANFIGGANNGAGANFCGPTLEPQAPLLDLDRAGATKSEAVPLGVDVGGDGVIAALWRQGAGTPATPCAVPAVATWVRPATVEVGAAAEKAWRQRCDASGESHAVHTIVDPTRLLGRNYGTLAGTTFIDAEAEHQACAVAAEADGGAARFVLSHARLNQNLRNRAGGSAKRKTGPLVKQVAHLPTSLTPVCSRRTNERRWRPRRRCHASSVGRAPQRSVPTEVRTSRRTPCSLCRRTSASRSGGRRTTRRCSRA